LADPFEVWSTRLFPKGQGADAYRLTGLAARCDWVVLSDSAEPVTYLRIRSGAPISPRTVFLSLRNPLPAIEYFACEVLPKISSPFILFSGSEDVTTPTQTDHRWKPYPPAIRAAIDSILAHPGLTVWWAENIDEAAHPKLQPMPLGLLPSNGGAAMAEPFEFAPLISRPLAVLCGHRIRQGPQWEPRRQVSALARDVWQDWTTLLNDPVEEPVFKRLLSRHAFVLCVEGGGLDPSPKAWLALLNGAIPIIRKSPTAAAYEDLPVIIIDDWKNDSITLDKLESWRAGLSEKFQQAADWRHDWYDCLSFNQGWHRRTAPLDDAAHALRLTPSVSLQANGEGLVPDPRVVPNPKTPNFAVEGRQPHFPDTAACEPNSCAVSNSLYTPRGGVSLYYSIAHSRLAFGDGVSLSQTGEALPFDREELYERLHGEAGAHLVIWAAPVAHLVAASLSDGMNADDALQWVEKRATDILDLFRRFRRLVLVLPARVSWMSSEVIAESTQAYFADRIQPNFQIGADEAPRPTPSVELYRLVSAAVIQSSPTLMRLDQELHAIMARVKPQPDLKKQEINAALDELSGISRPVLLREQPAGVEEGPQSALDAQRSLVAEIQDALIVCQEELAWYHRLAANKKGGLEQRRVERQLLAAQSERDFLRTKVSDLLRQLEWAKHDAIQVRHALEATRQSTSWKLTAPFRKLREGTVAKRDKKLLEGPVDEKDTA